MPERTQRDHAWAGEPRILMAVRPESGEVLWKHEGPVVPMSVVVDEKRVYSHHGEKIQAFDRTTGKKLWESEPIPVWKSIMSWFAPTIVAYQGVILFAGGENVKPRDTLYFAYRDFQRAVRDEQYKLIEYVVPPSQKKGEEIPGARETQLFDLKVDPKEMHDLAEDSQYQDVVERMRVELRRQKEAWADDGEDFWGGFETDQ